MNATLPPAPPAPPDDGPPAPPAAAPVAAAPAAPSPMLRRFRGFLPVVIDVETGGFEASTDALLQIAAVLIEIDASGRLSPGESYSYHVRPFEGARLDPASLQVNKIDPWHPLRPAIDEADALQRIFREIRTHVRRHGCRRAVLVGHNAAFDLAFLNATVKRAAVKRNPFHPFSCFDTATLGGAALGQTVLAKASVVAGLEWDKSRAHSASYDAERTAALFCLVCNELTACYARADERARALGWQSAPQPLEPDEADTPAAPGAP
ncbi:MAG TPA: ribonuclease T [Steroidobacteraceae bacterium]|nr:ribonuclease T [Steroidobacteraceae bacterium]